MEIHCRFFKLNKKGSPPEEYEDAFSVNDINTRIAIADGACESSFAKEWANLLTSGFVAESVDFISTHKKDKTRREITAWLSRWLEPLQEKWRNSIDGNTLPWYARNKFRRGAYATFLGLQFEDPTITLNNPIHWRAIAIGDSVLFKLRGNRMKIAFPLKHSKDFGYSPALISSRRLGNEDIWGEVHTKPGIGRPGDVFILATDALAKWLLAQQENGVNPWKIIKNISEDDSFVKLVQEERDGNRLQNDDTSLAIIKILAGKNKVSNQQQGDIGV